MEAGVWLGAVGAMEHSLVVGFVVEEDDSMTLLYPLQFYSYSY